MQFNAYVSTYPHTSNLIISYADDFTTTASNKNLHEATRAVAEYATHVEAWANEPAPHVCTLKSIVTLFTLETPSSTDFTGGWPHPPG